MSNHRDAQLKAMANAQAILEKMHDPEYKEKTSFIQGVMRHQSLDEVKWKSVKWFIPYAKVINVLIWIEAFRKKNWKQSLTKNEIELYNYCIDRLVKLGRNVVFKKMKVVE